MVASLLSQLLLSLGWLTHELHRCHLLSRRLESCALIILFSLVRSFDPLSCDLGFFGLYVSLVALMRFNGLFHHILPLHLACACQSWYHLSSFQLSPMTSFICSGRNLSRFPVLLAISPSADLASLGRPAPVAQSSHHLATAGLFYQSPCPCRSKSFDSSPINLALADHSINCALSTILCQSAWSIAISCQSHH